MRRYAAIGLLLVGCAAALLYQTRRLGLTIDETSHFAAAYAYWQGEDVLEPPDAPPLTRAICGWVPRLLKAPQLRDTNGWKERDAYLIGAEILDRPNIRARRLLFYTRLPFLLFPLLIVFLLWHWGRQLFGEPVAILLAVCGALEPTITRPRRADQFRRARRLWSAVVGLHGLEILVHAECAALVAPDAGDGRGRAYEVHPAAAGHPDVRTGPLEGSPTAGGHRHSAGSLFRNPGRFAVSGATGSGSPKSNSSAAPAFPAGLCPS